MLLHAFSVNVLSSLREFPENCVYNHCRLNCFIAYLHGKLLTANFLSNDIEMAKKVHLLDLHIKTINFLFYNYVFHSSQKWLNFWYKSVISSVEVDDKQIITCHFSYHTLYQLSFIYHPLSLSALGLISWPRADKGHDMKNAMQ